MGIELEFVDGEGPVIHNPIRAAKHVEALRVPDPEEHLRYVLTSLRWTREELNDKVPLIGFAGAPFTLASYMIEGGASRNYLLTKKLMYEAAPAWHMLMSKLVQTLSAYLLAQARAGAQVIQVFDSWVGCLGPADYYEYVHPHTKKLFDALREARIPTIHFGTGTADLLPLMREAGGEVLGVDWRTHLDEAWNRIGPKAGIQGNLDPVTLMAPKPILQARAKDILDRAAGRAGHIFNLGHGILPLTPVDSIKALVAYVHEYSASRASSGNLSRNPESRIQNPE
jgi:uroporphyrinogen decarboxylase